MRILLFCLVLITPASTYAATFGTVEIAPRTEALTFARAETDAGERLLLISSYESGVVSGIDLTASFPGNPTDPVQLFNAMGYDTLANLQDGALVSLPVSQLSIPVDLGEWHIAAGTNFPEHADEATVEDGPFLFPKEAAPTSFNASIPAGEGLLDYEVELCFVGLAPMNLSQAPERAGLLLCQDMTDRAKLMRHINAENVTSGDGFTTGKSGPGFLPVGNLFVVPRMLRPFAADVQLNLYLNGELRQSAVQSQAIWDFDDLLREIKDRETVQWDYQDGQAGLAIEDGKIPMGVAILGGTPSGTIFQGPETTAIVMGLFDWLAFGWDRTLIERVIERQIAQSMAAGTYLQPGDRLQIHAPHLGELDNVVSP